MKSNVIFSRFSIVFLSILFLSCISKAAQVKNISSSGDSLHCNMQISFLPYIGTNGFLSDSVSCDISLNLIAGSVKEVRYCELGGLFNRVRKNAGKCQLAGIGNMVGGTSDGFQGAGILNIATAAKGVQAAGILNFTKESEGMQLAGLANHSSKGKPVQIAGLANHSGEMSRLQVAGLVNNAPKVELFQVAGLVNNASEVDGFQVAGLANNGTMVKNFQAAGLANNTSEEIHFQAAGLVNNARKVKGAQMAGLLNIAEESDGAQLSGLVNKARFFKGIQLGVFNFADSCQGTPIGVISIVKNGYHKIEVSADETFYSNLSFRSGTYLFHTIFTAGIRPDNFDSPLWTYGGGLGTSIPVTTKSSFDLDVLFQHIVKDDYFDNNFLYKLYIGFDRRIFGKTSVSLGATYNFLVLDTRSRHYDKFTDTAPYYFTNRTYSSGFNLKTWAGVKVAIRFL